MLITIRQWPGLIYMFNSLGMQAKGNFDLLDLLIKIPIFAPAIVFIHVLFAYIII